MATSGMLSMPAAGQRGAPRALRRSAADRRACSPSTNGRSSLVTPPWSRENGAQVAARKARTEVAIKNGSWLEKQMQQFEGQVQPVTTPTGSRRAQRPGHVDTDFEIECRRSTIAVASGTSGNMRAYAQGAPLVAARNRGHLHQDQAAALQQGADRWGASSSSWVGDGLGRAAQRQPSLSAAGRPTGLSPAVAPTSLTSESIATICTTAREANPGFRSHMEDESKVIDPFLVGERPGDLWSYFAVYDGHGGRAAVDYVEGKLHGLVFEELRAALACAGLDAVSDEAVSEVLSRAFQRADEQLRILGTWRCGCTATVVLAHRTTSSLRLHVANVGDSRCIVVDSDNRECRLSMDHRPNDPAEIQRVELEGGFVTRGRVAGQLGVSRALGDHSLKSVGVSWRPSVCARDASRDVALVIGSDGLWDAMSDASARILVDRCMSDHGQEKAAELLMREALRAGSTDNITTLVAFFGKAKSQVGWPGSGGA